MSKDKLSTFDRIAQSAVGAGLVVGDVDDPVAKECPQLWRWMSETSAGDDHVKEPATLTVKLVPGGVLASLGDRTFGVSIDASCTTLSSVWQALEAVLCSPAPPIRQWPKHEIQLRKKRKKE